jgi:hypothetical protein
MESARDQGIFDLQVGDDPPSGGSGAVGDEVASLSASDWS